MSMYISIGIIIITIGLLKGTHVKVYNNFGTFKLIDEYDISIPIWAILIIILIGLIPIYNIIAFISFIIFYIVHVVWNPKELEGDVHVFTLKNNNLITRSILLIKSFLCKKL